MSLVLLQRSYCCRRSSSNGLFDWLLVGDAYEVPSKFFVLKCWVFVVMGDGGFRGDVCR